MKLRYLYETNFGVIPMSPQRRKAPRTAAEKTARATERLMVSAGVIRDPDLDGRGYMIRNNLS